MVLKCFREGLPITDASQMLAFLLPLVTCNPKL